jgi:beta-glucanase (GH16 family)
MHYPTLLKRAAPVLFALLLAASLVFTFSSFTTAGAQTSSLTLRPVADAYVNRSSPDSNYGSRSTLSVDGSPVIRSFLRFDVRGLNGARVSSARLRLYVTDDSANGFNVAPVSSTSWSEGSITHNNAPSVGSAIRSIGSYNANRWIELDVSSAVLGEGLVSLALVTSHDTTTAFASREAGSTNAPQLVLSLQSAPTATPTRVAPSVTPTMTSLPVIMNTATPAAPAQPLPVGQSGNWRMVFNDEFNGSSLDTSKWHTCFWWATNTCTIETNNELQLYNREDVLVQNGILRLRAQRRNMVGWNGRTFNYTSGMVMTGGRRGEIAPGFTYTYGYAEARFKIPAGQGLWPAFWMLPLTYESRPEIDIMEILGHEPNVQHMNYHYIGGDQGRTWTGPNFSTDYHTFGVDWSPTAIVWYVDGVERWRFTDVSKISSQPEYLLLNLAVGGNWPGSPNSSTVFPSYFDVDYVRVWQR